VPTYEYHCKACGEKFETMISSAEKNKVRCPACQSRNLQEVYGFNVIKGSSQAEVCQSCPAAEKGCRLAN